MKSFIENEFQNVEIPRDLHDRCCLGIQKAEGEMYMKHKKSWIKRISATAAAFMVCLIVFNGSAIADTVKGMFQDIVGIDGAVTGTAYEVGVDEVLINCQGISMKENTMEVDFEITVSDLETAPFAFVENLQIGDLTILDKDGNTIAVISYPANLDESSPIENGKTSLHLIINSEELENCQNPTFKIQTLYGHSKADAPLEIRGDWNVEILSLNEQ